MRRRGGEIATGRRARRLLAGEEGGACSPTRVAQVVRSAVRAGRAGAAGAASARRAGPAVGAGTGQRGRVAEDGRARGSSAAEEGLSSAAGVLCAGEGRCGILW